MIKVSPTNLQSYADYLNEYIDQQELIGRVSKTLPETEAMTKGKLFHEAVETGVSGYFQDAFSRSVIDCLKEWIMIHEYKHFTMLDIDGVDVKLQGIADGISGSYVHEIKTTSRPISFDILNKYRNSVQALCYQLIFEKEVKFHIVQLKELEVKQSVDFFDYDDGVPSSAIYGQTTLEVVDYCTIDTEVNLAICRNSIRILTRGFIDCCKVNNLEQFITEVVE